MGNKYQWKGPTLSFLQCSFPVSWSQKEGRGRSDGRGYESDGKLGPRRKPLETPSEKTVDSPREGPTATAAQKTVKAPTGQPPQLRLKSSNTLLGTPKVRLAGNTSLSLLHEHVLTNTSTGLPNSLPSCKTRSSFQYSSPIQCLDVAVHTKLFQSGRLPPQHLLPTSLSSGSSPSPHTLQLSHPATLTIGKSLTLSN